MAQAANEITIRFIEGGWKLEIIGGSLTILDMGGGIAIAGNWECDGTDPHAALRLYRAAVRLTDAMNFDEILIHTGYGDNRLFGFYTRMGWEPTQIIYRKK